MSMYGSGVSMAQAMEMDKERVRHAMFNELVVGEDENGFVYERATREECHKFVMETLDGWYFTAKQLADCGRAMERLLEARGVDWKRSLPEFMALMDEESEKFGGFVYEHDIDDMLEEAEGIMGGE